MTYCCMFAIHFRNFKLANEGYAISNQLLVLIKRKSGFPTKKEPRSCGSGFLSFISKGCLDIFYCLSTH